MKRKEVVHKLKIILQQAEVIYANNPEPSFIKEEFILTQLELIGMQPPNIIKSPDSYNRSEGTYGYEVASWEDET
jgi:hypothetical protein